MRSHRGSICVAGDDGNWVKGVLLSESEDGDLDVRVKHDGTCKCHDLLKPICKK